MSVNFRNKKRQDDKSPTLWTILVVVILFVIFSFVVAYRFLRRKEASLQSRYEKVNYLLAKKKQLKKKFDRIFSISYALLRVLVILIILGYGYCVGYLWLGYTSLGPYINLLTGLLLVVIGVVFLFKGTKFDFFKFISTVKKEVALKIYGKYINIDEQIDSLKKEKAKIKKEKKKLKDYK